MPRALTQLKRGDQLAKRAAESLRRAILRGEVAPGSRLSVPDVARRLGISRTPAREALLVLKQDGLLAAGTYGLAVITGGLTDIEKLLEVREGLEGMSARLAATRMSEAAKDELRSLIGEYGEVLRQRNIGAHVELDNRFHTLLALATGNERLADALRAIHEQTTVLNNALSRADDWSPTAVDHDHGSIARAVLAGDADAAEATMRRHMRRLREFYIATVAKS